MPLKLCGAALLLLAGFFAGGAYAAACRQATGELAALLHALEFTRAQIAFLASPLPAIFELLAADKSCGALFSDAAQALSRGGDFSAAVCALCARIGDRQAREEIERLFRALETSDSEQAQALLAKSHGAIESLLREKEQRAREKAPLARRIALAVSALLAIVFI